MAGYNFEEKDNKKKQEEYRAVFNESETLLTKYSKILIKCIITFGIVFLISYIALLVVSLLNSGRNGGVGVGNFSWLFAEFIVLAIFLFDPKVEESKKESYETDMKVLLDGQIRKIKFMRIKLITFIVVSMVLIVTNIICWGYVAANLMFEI